MTEEIKFRAKELIDWANSRLGNERFFLRIAQGKIVAVIFADPNSLDYEEFINQRLSQPKEKHELINQLSDKLELAKSLGKSGSVDAAEAVLRQIQELQSRIELEVQVDADPPLGQVFAILTGVMQYCDRYYDNPDKLQNLLHYVVRDFREDARS